MSLSWSEKASIVLNLKFAVFKKYGDNFLPNHFSCSCPFLHKQLGQVRSYRAQIQHPTTVVYLSSYSLHVQSPSGGGYEAKSVKRKITKVTGA